MSKLMQALLVSLSFILLAALACGTPSTLTETITEEELNEEVADEGFAVDLQPGMIVMSGVVEGMEVVVEMTAEASGGGVLMQITKVTVGGEELPADMFADLGAEMSQTVYSENEDYVVESVTISDTEITIVSKRK